jgi:membrane-bound lytic murein transglycosylase F
MAKSFAQYLGVELYLYVTYSTEDTINALRELKGDIAAGGLSYTSKRDIEFIFASPYYEVEKLVVCHRDFKGVNTFEDLEKYSFEVSKDTTYAQTLILLKQSYPNIRFKLNELSSETILKKVSDKEIECTIIDSNIFSMNRRYFPQIMDKFSVGEKDKLAWMLRSSDTELRDAINSWYHEFKKNELSHKLEDKYFSFTKDYDYVDNKVFIKRIDDRLPKYIDYFKEAGKMYDIPWQFLAAVSYKESHWNRKAKSPTGVRGLMMLTLDTAKFVGIKSRLNAKESIFGGAKYIKYLLDKIPKEVQGKLDRLKYSMVAYNIGFGHLLDAIELAKKYKVNPYEWKDFKEIIPLLSDKQYYKELKFGFANGIVAKIYVKHILDFYDILQNIDLEVVNDRDKKSS